LPWSHELAREPFRLSLEQLRLAQEPIRLALEACLGAIWARPGALWKLAQRPLNSLSKFALEPYRVPEQIKVGRGGLQ